MTRNADKPSEVLRQAAEWLRALQQEQHLEVDIALRELVTRATHMVPAAQHAAIMLVRNNTVRTVSATGPLPRLLDQLQSCVGEGPGLTAAREERAVRVDDIALDVQWPAYSQISARDTPVRSVLSLYVPNEANYRGALNLYAESPNAFDAEAEECATTYATFAGMAWLMVRRTAQFQNALASRDKIGQAKGMVMERFKLDADQAFTMLKRLSQSTNTPVAQVAARLVDFETPKPLSAHDRRRRGGGGSGTSDSPEGTRS